MSTEVKTRRPIEYPVPQPITDAQKTGERFLVWQDGQWMIGEWCPPTNVLGISSAGCWDVGDGQFPEHPTHYLPMPPDVKP